MTVKELVSNWLQQAQCKLTEETYQVNLTLEDAAKIDALAEMYPRRTKEQLVSELVSAALAELEISFPYVQGTRVISIDELGEPVYEDVGPTPQFLEKTKENLQKQRLQKTA
ncbi:hypothetical protein [Teredinibacter turnerae]|uniref:Type 1 pili tip component n=1 Tax=Teredinibacter turnerae (strain ATCC 39867 / T7901) TaxID=377629 RepID=C5BRP3_TERTT|nr:hypothetical protein [Teredinibacter turnerae]ACR13088.1 conserved hypothetical protein [Teredinibacter turnerae T7901]